MSTCRDGPVGPRRRPPTAAVMPAIGRALSAADFSLVFLFQHVSRMQVEVGRGPLVLYRGIRCGSDSRP